MSSSSSTTVERYGLTEVFTCDNPAADVIFVHGLNGDPERTWTSQATGKFWPRDLLPNDLSGRARILTYGYDADVVAWGGSGGVGKDMLHNHAERLVATLVANRRRQHAEERPIIFVAHSLGGLVVKRALIYSNEIRVGTRTERLRSVFLSTYGILFLGTPHHGSDVAFWGSYLEKIAGVVLPKRFVDSAPQLVSALKSNSETLINIDRGFASLVPLFHVYFFHEAKKTDMKGTLQFIVEEDSAAPTLPDVERASIPADHSHMCKFDSEKSAGYDLVSDAVSYYVEDAEQSHAVASRWQHEKQVRRIGQGSNYLTEGYGSPQISEPSSRGSSPGPAAGKSAKQLPPSGTRDETSFVRLPQLLDTLAAESFFFVPPGFRPNSHFVGMKKQLAELDERLFDSQARQRGTSAAVLYGPPGCGKSHLAQQYLFKHRSKFKGGIFWINARSVDEMSKDIWSIAQKFVARDSPNIRIDPYGNGREYISATMEWFKSRPEWLVVIDGIAVNDSARMDAIQKMIPDRKDSSLIYTSRSSQLYASQRLLHPHPIRVPKLTEKEGQELMFKELNVKRTRSNEKAAIELVKTVGGLPLAIHAMSSRLAETHEPLEKYSPKSYADDPRLGVYNEILDDLWQYHPEAYSLMNILAFLGPHIPVELVMLGLKALHAETELVEVRSRPTPYESPDINTSFGILMRNALIERNEPDDTDSAASSRSSLLEPEPIDVLRLHSVVQRFCRDRLNKNKHLPIWIKLAWNLCERSYQEAKQRMDERAKEGDSPRVSDFREYLIHAQRIRDHTFEYEHRNRDCRELRANVERLIAEIKKEIAQREPNSSQESVIRHYAVSIFDRTSSWSSTDEAPVTPSPGYKQLPQLAPGAGETLWGTDLNQTPIISPTEAEYREAVRMLQRSLSNHTVRPEPVFANDFEVAKEPQHNRSGSRPEFNGGRFVIPVSMGQARLDNGTVTGAMATPPMSREGNLSASSRAHSELTEIYRNSPPPARGGAFVSSRRSTPPTHDIPIYSPNGADRDRPNLSRNISVRRPAEPKLTRYIPNPAAPEFVPSSWPGYTSFQPNMSDSIAWSNWNTATQNGFQVTNPVPVNFQDQVEIQNQAQSRQIRSSIGNASIDANIHANPGQQPSLLDPIYYQAHQGRAASVPEIPLHQISGLWPNEQPATVMNPQSYTPNMSRDNSSQSRSSGSGVTVLRPPSVPQMTSPFTTPSHPLAQVSNTSLANTSPLTFVPRSSPLQNMQTPEQARSPGSISPMTMNSGSQHPSPPLALGSNGQPFQIPSMNTSIQSGPATSMFPPPPPPSSLGSYAPSPLPELPATVNLPMPHSSPVPAGQPMSRGSSGPGIVVAAPGYGLGIAEFGQPNGAIRFGQQEPVNIAEAQRRAESQRRYLDQERQRLIEAQRRAAYRGIAGQPFGIQSDILPTAGTTPWSLPVSMMHSIPQLPTAGGGPVPMLVGPAPYPDVNLMPSNSDTQALQGMVDERVGRGFATPLMQQQQQQAQRAQMQSPPMPQAMFAAPPPPAPTPPQQQRPGNFSPTRSRGRGFSEPTREGWPVANT